MIIEYIWVVVEIMACLSVYFYYRDKIANQQIFLSTSPDTPRAVDEFKPEEDILPPYTPPTPKTRAAMADLPPSYQETFDITDLPIPIHIETPAHIETPTAGSIVTGIHEDDDMGDDGGNSSCNSYSVNCNGRNAIITTNDITMNNSMTSPTSGKDYPTTINNSMNGPTSSGIFYPNTMNTMVNIPATQTNSDIYSIPIVVV